MPDEVKLEPCPFCGGDAEIEETGGSQSANFATHYRVNCKVYAHANMAWTTDRNEAIAAWNTRALATSNNAELVEVLSALSRLADQHIAENDAPDRVQWEGIWYDGPLATAYLQTLRAVQELALSALSKPRPNTGRV